MAIEKIIKIIAETKQAAKDIKDLYEDMIDQQKEADKQQEKLNESIEDLGESAKNSEKGLKSIKKGISGIGLAFKALGIGLIISAFNTFKEVLLSNQEVADFFSTTMNAVNIVFNKTVGVLIDAVKYTSEATGGFDALGKVLSSLITLQLTPLKLAFFSIKQAITGAQLLWEKSFFGDKDPETIKTLQEEFDKTAIKITEIGEDAVKAGVSIVNNFSEAVGEISTLTSKVTEGIKEISITASIEQAKTITQARNNFELLSLQQQRLQLQYQKEAEILRQIRDDDLLSIEKRIEANESLSEVLKLQNEAEANTIKARISGLQAEQNALGATIERTNELFQLNTDLIDVQERLTGQESEQLTNKNSLLKEQINLTKTLSDGEKERLISRLEFEESQEESNALKLEKERERLNLENELISEDIEIKRELFLEGTQARVDAENEYLFKKQEIDNKLTENNAKRLKQQLDDENKVNEAKSKIREANISNISKGISIISQLDTKSRALQAVSVIAENAVGVGKTIINTQAANAAATLKYAALPGGIALAAAERAANNVGAGLSIAASVLATKNALSQLKQGGGVESSGVQQGGEGSEPSAPSFNIVAGTGTNQIAESLAQEQQPIEAFVVSSNVTTGQSLDRNILESSTI